MTPGGTAYEAIQLNIESLWTGGPFADPVSSLAKYVAFVHCHDPLHGVAILSYYFACREDEALLTKYHFLDL
jgi:hypothetical protein